MLKMPASRASFTCMSPAVPVSCMAASACIDTPVAPIGWPLALRPPDGLTGSRPSFCRSSPPRSTRAPCPCGARPIASYSISSAMVKQSCVSTNERSLSAMPACGQRALPGLGAAFELEDVALRHRQEVLHVRGRAERDRLVELAARSRRRPAPRRRRRRTPSEQSVRLSGPATNGFFSLSVRQNS